MARIIPKMNLNRTPQAVDNGSMVFAKDVMLNKDNSLGRDEVLINLDLPELENDEHYVGVISNNNEFYLFTNSNKIIRYDELEKETTVYDNVWEYSNGKIVGKVMTGLNGDTLLIVCEYDATNNNQSVDVPIKTINLNRPVSDKTQTTQSPTIPFVNLSYVDNYSARIPKGVYQFFIRFEIAKDYYTNWFLCSKELYSYNSTIKSIVQGKIKHNDENSDSDFSFVLKAQTIFNGTNYNRFQLGFILTNDDASICRTWKHFDKKYLNANNANNKIYFSYEKTDIEEYDIDEMLKETFNLYNVKNVTSFKNRLYVANYKETDFNPSITTYGKVEYKYIDEIVKSRTEYYKQSNAYVDYIPDTDTEKYEFKYETVSIPSTISGDYSYFFKQNKRINVTYLYDFDTSTPRPITRFIPQLPRYEYYSDIERSATFNNEFFTFGVTATNVQVSDVDYYGGCNLSGALRLRLGDCGGCHTFAECIDYINDKLVNLPNETAISINNGGWVLRLANEDNTRINDGVCTLGYIGDAYSSASIYDACITSILVYFVFDGVYYHIAITSTSGIDKNITYTGVFEKKVVEDIRNLRTLLPKTGYNFYIHFVKNNGEITNGYKLSMKNNANKVTQYFDKNEYRCVPEFTDITYPSGYVAAFITYAKVANKFIDVNPSKENYKVNLDDENPKAYLYDCLEIDIKLSPRYDDIKILNGNTDNPVVDAKYYSSYDYSPTYPRLFGASGKIAISADVSGANIEHPYILDEFEIGEDQLELIRLTPIFNEASYDSYSEMNLNGFVSKVWKPTKDELLYYCTGTDVYTKNHIEPENVDEYDNLVKGDLATYKDKLEINDNVEPDEITVISEYNFDCLSLANEILDITRPYYVLKKGTTESGSDTDYSASTYGNKIDSNHGGGKGFRNSYSWDNCYILIPNVKIKQSHLGVLKKYVEQGRNLTNSCFTKYDITQVAGVTNDDPYTVNISKTDLSVDDVLQYISGQTPISNNIAIQHSVYHLNADDANYKRINSDEIADLDESDIGNSVTIVYKYSYDNLKDTWKTKILTETQLTKIDRYGTYIVSKTEKIVTKYEWSNKSVILDNSTNFLVPDPEHCLDIFYGGYEYVPDGGENRNPTMSILRDVSRKSDESDDNYGFGLTCQCISRTSEDTEPETDVSKNEAEVNAYQQYSYAESLNLSSFYKLPSMYQNIVRKTYSIHDEDTITEFNNTIRSSDVFADESRKYIFEFGAERYYNVDCSKGIIVNLITLGNYIIVHTKDSIFQFSGSNSLETTEGQAQLKESDVFDTGIKEIVGSEYGYCGLQKKNHACATQSGYFFYDASVNKIYAYTGQGSINNISDSIDKVMKYNDIVDVNIANDYYNDRLLISIDYIDNKFATLSFNYRVSAFLSAHYFRFDKSFNTKSNVYYAASEGANSGYFNAVFKSDIKPSNYVSEWNNFNYNNLLCPNNCEDYSVIDVIYNENYEHIKTLDYLNWICNAISDTDNSFELLAEDNFNSKVITDNSIPYKGNKIQIYTDVCSTAKVDIVAESQTNDIEDYSTPRFNNGIWSWNYFRNRQSDANYESDNDSLIHGKYFVARFIFDKDNYNFKLENVTFNVTRER